MANKKLGLEILVLVLVLVFGMTVVGCDDTPEEEDTNPSPPTGLAGTVVSPNNSIQLTWNPVNNADEYWIEYKKNSSSVYQSKSGIKTTSYTFTDLDYATKYDFRVAVRNTDYYVSSYSSPVSIDTGNPLTANVSLSMKTTCNNFNFGLKPYGYSIHITLTLPDGVWWNFDWTADPYPSRNFITSWVSMSGTPDVSDWTLVHYSSSSTDHPRTLDFSFGYDSTSDNISISGLTASIVTDKLTEMKNYTNVVDSLTAGSPSSASSSSWIKNF